MPEGPEVETERLHEAIHEELEKEGGTLLRNVALSTALFAAIAAISSLWAGATVNDALVLKTEATRLQAEASDQWAYYQAKGIKAGLQDVRASAWQAGGKEIPGDVIATRNRYTQEQAGIEKKAHELEHERDEKSEEADHLLHHHHSFAAAVALLQVAIALGAITALTRIWQLWAASCAVALAGIVYFVIALLP